MHYHPQFGIPGWGLTMSDEAYGTAREAWAHIEPALRDNRAEDVMRLDGADAPRDVHLAYIAALMCCNISDRIGTLHVPGLHMEDPGMTYGVKSCDDSSHKIMEEVK